MRYIFFILLAISLPSVAYEVFQPNEIPQTITNKSEEEQLLFILDFSQSMSERYGEKSKSQMVQEVITKLLVNTSNNTPIGLRVYGHKCGLTAMQACKASQLLVPIEEHNQAIILDRLKNIKPRGMTPITYSLKEAINKDFKATPERKHIILFTDGGENCDESPCKYAIELSKIRKDVNIDVIAFNIENQDDLEQLECTALVTKGEFYKAQSKPELEDILNKILNEQKQVEAKIYKH